MMGPKKKPGGMVEVPNSISNSGCKSEGEKSGGLG